MNNPKARTINLRISVIFAFIIIPLLSSFGQTKLDSLKIVFDSATSPMSKYEAEYDIGRYYYENQSYDTAIIKFKLAVQMVPAGDFELKGKTLRTVGNVYQKTEDLTNAIKYYKLSFKVFKQNNCKKELVGDILMKIGRSFYGYSQYDSAMVYYMEAKKVYEENKIRNEDYGHLMHYIGSVFKRQKNMEKACEYYQMEIDYGAEKGLPMIYAEGFYLNAECVEGKRERLDHNIRALHLFEELGNQKMTALMIGNIALGYESLDMLDSAYYYHMISLESRRKDGGKSHLASELSNIGGLLVKMGRYDEALKYLEEAEDLALSSDLKRNLRLASIYKNLYRIHEYKGNYKTAIEFLSLMYVYRDSSRDSEHQDAIHEMEIAYETEKTKSENFLLKAEGELNYKKKLLAEDDAARQSRAKNFYFFGGIILLILGVFTFIKLRESQKQKRIIIRQKKEVEFQKELVDQKNKDIMDSMVYASTIQQAIITSEDYISDMFDDFFVLYKPRDIVSGDFYWAYKTGDGKKLIAVGDCTGHGVPGAMMSMLGTAFLNEIVIEGGESCPENVLEKMRQQIIKAMASKGARDGMDMSFCAIEENKITFCGANLPIYIVRNGELIELKGNKQPIGKHVNAEQPFESREMVLKKNDLIYLFSDGYADQFGGPKGKKYKYKTFRNRLVEICQLTMVQQKKLINDEFELWRGDLEQLDDVCVIGLRI